MFCLQIASSDEEDIESIPKMLLDETIAVWSEVTPSGGADGALLAAMPADWAAPLRPIAPPSIADIVRQGFDSIPRVVSPRLLARVPSVATTDGSDAVPVTQPGSPEPPYSPVIPVDPGSPSTPDPAYWLICQQCGEESNGKSQWCSSHYTCKQLHPPRVTEPGGGIPH